MYRWKRFPFGLSASSEIFWRLNRYVNYLPKFLPVQQTTRNQHAVSHDKKPSLTGRKSTKKASGEVKLLLWLPPHYLAITTQRRSLKSDTSKKDLGATPLQRGKPIAHWDCEKRYARIKKEMHAKKRPKAARIHPEEVSRFGNMIMRCSISVTESFTWPIDSPEHACRTLYIQLQLNLRTSTQPLFSLYPRLDSERSIKQLRMTRSCNPESCHLAGQTIAVKYRSR